MPPGWSWGSAVAGGRGRGSWGVLSWQVEKQQSLTNLRNLAKRTPRIGRGRGRGGGGQGGTSCPCGNPWGFQGEAHSWAE
jgi:hypothetical protein